MFLIFSYCTRQVVISGWGFNLYFPRDKLDFSLFSCTYLPFIYLLCEMSINFFGPLFKLGCLGFVYSLMYGLKFICCVIWRLNYSNTIYWKDSRFFTGLPLYLCQISDRYVYIYDSFWTFYYVALIYLWILMPIPYCIDNVI